MATRKLDVFKRPHFDDNIVKEEFHTYNPRTRNFNQNDEIRITVHQQDLFTLPCESYIYIEGDINIPANIAQGATYEIINNAFAFLFEEIRYEINGQVVDSTKQVGISTLLKGYVSYNKSQSEELELSGWCIPNNNQALNFIANKRFFVCLPLKNLMGFAEDYKRIIMFARQELILIRSRDDRNCYQSEQIKDIEFSIKNVEWRIPHVQLKQDAYLQLMKSMNKDTTILLPFRKWEICELPGLKPTTKDIWAVKTTSSVERPRYVIIGLQENRKDRSKADITKFDHCNIRNVKIYLNSEAYPYDYMDLKFSEDKYAFVYKMYSKFQSSYYGKDNEPLFKYNDFKDHMLYVFDVSHQNEALKSSVVDLKIEMESETPFKDETRAYALIISDTIFEYTPVSSQARKLI